MGRKASQAIKPKGVSLYMYDDTMQAIKRIQEKYGLKAESEAIRLAISIVDSSPKLIITTQEVTVQVVKHEAVDPAVDPTGKSTETDVFGDPVEQKPDAQ